MKLHNVIFLVVLLAVQACNEKGEPEPEPAAFLTFNLSDEYYLYDDMWVFATDETGKVLDAHSITPGSSVTFKTLSPPEFFDLTVYYNGGGTLVNHMFYTYAGIHRGEEITLEIAPNSDFWPPVTGKATINIQNCSPYSFFNFSDGLAFSQFQVQSNTSADAVLDLRQETSNILISSHKAIDQPVYGWVDNVTNAEAFTIDFNNLTPFPKIISFLFSESMSAFIIGEKAGVGRQGYVMGFRSFIKNPADPAQAKFGYLDGFDEYYLSASTSKVTSTYYQSTYLTKKGTTLPEVITFPDNSLTIENSSIGNFSFNYSTTSTFSDHYWRQEATDYTMHWRVYTDQPTTPHITGLPEAFTIKYPSLSVNNLTYISSYFHKYTDGYTYAQLLSDRFKSITSSGRRDGFSGDSFQQK